jgi:FkbM family methyltransferase
MGVLRFLEKQVMRGLGKGHGTKSIGTEVKSVTALLGSSDVSVCVDIGGNVGNYTAELLTIFPSAEIYTFEPSATNIDKLQQRFAQQPRVHLQPFAVSDSAGTTQLYSDSPGSGLASLSKRNLDHLNLPFEYHETITTIRFEDFWRDEMHECDIDILKMDIEGHELAALHGCGPAIAQTRAIQFEFGGCNIDTRTYFRDFWYFFLEHGFDLYRITPFGVDRIARYSERDEVFTTTNYIAIRKRS